MANDPLLRKILQFCDDEPDTAQVDDIAQALPDVDRDQLERRIIQAVHEGKLQAPINQRSSIDGDFDPVIGHIRITPAGRDCLRS